MTCAYACAFAHLTTTSDRMLQSMYICFFAVLASTCSNVTTISAVREITVNELSVNITAAMDKDIFNSTEMKYDPDTQPFCSTLHDQSSALRCGQGRLFLLSEHCVTFNEKTELLSIFSCPYYQWYKYKYPTYLELQLP